MIRSVFCVTHLKQDDNGCIRSHPYTLQIGYYLRGQPFLVVSETLVDPIPQCPAKTSVQLIYTLCALCVFSSHKLLSPQQMNCCFLPEGTRSWIMHQSIHSFYKALVHRIYTRHPQIWPTPAEFSSKTNQTHLTMLIIVFKIIKKHRCI